MASLNVVLPIDKHKTKKKTLNTAVNKGRLTPSNEMAQIGVWLSLKPRDNKGSGKMERAGVHEKALSHPHS